MSKSVNQVSVPHMDGRRTDNKIERKQKNKKIRQYKGNPNSNIVTKLKYKTIPFDFRLYNQIPEEKYKKGNEIKTIHTQRRKEAKFKEQIQTSGYGRF